MMYETLALSISLAALSIALIAYSKSHNKNETSVSIEWDKVLKWLTLPAVITISIIMFIAWPSLQSKINDTAITIGNQPFNIDPTYFLLPVIVFPVAIVIGFVAMYFSFREPSNTQQQKKETKK